MDSAKKGPSSWGEAGKQVFGSLRGSKENLAKKETQKDTSAWGGKTSFTKDQLKSWAKNPNLYKETGKTIPEKERIEGIERIFKRQPGTLFEKGQEAEKIFKEVEYKYKWKGYQGKKLSPKEIEENKKEYFLLKKFLGKK